MNKLLIEELHAADQDAIKRAKHLVSKSNAVNNENFVDIISDEGLLDSVSTIALDFVKQGNRAVMLEQGWECLMSGDSISRGIVNLEDNAAIRFFTQVVIMISAALLENGGNDD